MPTRAELSRIAQDKREAARKEREARAAERGREAKPWNGLSAQAAFKVRYALDPEFNIKERLRAAFRRKRQGIKIGDLLRSAMIREGSTPTVERFLGYSASELKRHLERQFTSRMSWQAFCDGRIHIDHVIPLSSFDVSDAHQLKRAWGLANLRPLWAKANRTKHATRTLLL